MLERFLHLRFEVPTVGIYGNTPCDYFTVAEMLRHQFPRSSFGDKVKGKNYKELMLWSTDVAENKQLLFLIDNQSKTLVHN